MILWELCKKLKFNHTARWYMHEPKSVLENETHKHLKIKEDYLIPTRRADLMIVSKKKKENQPNRRLWRPGWPKSENQGKRTKRQKLRSYQRTKNAMEHGGDDDTNCYWCTWNDLQRLSKIAERVENRRTSFDHPDYSIVEVGKNTEKGMRHLKTLAFVQTPAKYYQLTLVGKSRKE